MLKHVFEKPYTAKQKILLTAHDLFYTLGIRATGIDKIIANSEVTKTTFYRHFRSKNILIVEFLQYRHQLWMTWFKECIDGASDLSEGMSKAMVQWFTQPNFRGCAFVNSLAEISTDLPEALTLIREHKRDVAQVIEQALVNVDENLRVEVAQAITMAMDGAIIRAQSGEDVNQTTVLLSKTVKDLMTA